MIIFVVLNRFCRKRCFPLTWTDSRSTILLRFPHNYDRPSACGQCKRCFQGQKRFFRQIIFPGSELLNCRYKVTGAAWKRHRGLGIWSGLSPFSVMLKLIDFLSQNEAAQKTLPVALWKHGLSYFLRKRWCFAGLLNIWRRHWEESQCSQCH